MTSPQRASRRTWRYLAIPLLAFTVVIATPTAALAAEPIKIVHEEQVSAGPYDLTLGFSRWPLAEGVSFDLVIDPKGGIADKSGTLSMITPSGQALDYEDVPLSRHPRQRDSWGLDVVSFQDTGDGGRWSIELTVDGAEGPGEARVVLPFDKLPGPSQNLSWVIAMVPTLLIWTTLAIAWIRVRPGRGPDAWALAEPARAS
jgi:hypothetical protein